MNFVLFMLVREMRASWRRLLLFFVCIAVGVGAIVAIRSVIQSVRQTFAGEARAFMSGDATIFSNQPLKPEVTERIAARLREARAESMRSVELATMARADRADGRARMVELRAVEPGFPYYGTLKLGDGLVFDHALLAGFGVLVRPELLAQLGVSVGDGLLDRVAAIHHSWRHRKRARTAAGLVQHRAARVRRFERPAEDGSVELRHPRRHRFSC